MKKHIWLIHLVLAVLSGTAVVLATGDAGTRPAAWEEFGADRESSEREYGAWVVPVVRGEDHIRDFLEKVMGTQYCGDAMAAGLGLESALKGKSPIDGLGFATVEEDEWFPVALCMGREDLATLCELHGKAVASEAKTGTTDKAIRESIDLTFGHLEKVVRLIGISENHADGAVDFLEDVFRTRMAGLQGNPVDRLGNYITGFWGHWVRQSDLETEAGVERCLKVAREYAGEYGFGSQGNFAFCANWLENGAKRCRPKAGYDAAARHVLASMEHFGAHGQCYILDRDALEGGLAGWEGSLQRRRMAERFINLEPPKVPRWDEKRQQEVLVPYEEAWALMLPRRAAAELAADEKDLTDLREVYGEW